MTFLGALTDNSVDGKNCVGWTKSEDFPSRRTGCSVELGMDSNSTQANTTLVSPRTWKSSWLDSHDWLRFDGEKAWCEPCRMFPSVASKKSALSCRDKYTGEAKSGFKYDPIRNHYLRKGSIMKVPEHEAAYSMWKRVLNKGDDVKPSTKDKPQLLLDGFIEQGLQEQIAQISKLSNTAHCLAKKN